MKQVLILTAALLLVVSCKKEQEAAAEYTTELRVTTNTRCHLLYDIYGSVDTAYVYTNWQDAETYTLRQGQQMELNCRVYLNDSVSSITMQVITNGVEVAQRTWQTGQPHDLNNSVALRYTHIADL